MWRSVNSTSRLISHNSIAFRRLRLYSSAPKNSGKIDGSQKYDFPSKTEGDKLYGVNVPNSTEDIITAERLKQYKVNQQAEGSRLPTWEEGTVYPDSSKKMNSQSGFSKDMKDKTENSYKRDSDNRSDSILDNLKDAAKIAYQKAKDTVNTFTSSIPAMEAKDTIDNSAKSTKEEGSISEKLKQAKDTAKDTWNTAKESEQMKRAKETVSEGIKGAKETIKNATESPTVQRAKETVVDSAKAAKDFVEQKIG